MKILPLLMIAGILTSCITEKKCWEKYPPQIKDSISYVEKIKDSTIYISDSAGINALLECDSLGKIRIRQIEQFLAGQMIKPSVVVRDNWIRLACKIDSGAVYFSWKETHVREVKTKVYVKITNHLTGFQNFLFWTGGILWVIFIIWLIIKIGVNFIPAGKIATLLSKI